MLRVVAILVLSGGLLASAASAQSTTAPATSADLTHSDGTAMVMLARRAMADYLAHRKGAQQAVVPDELKHLDTHSYYAAVTLRKDGKLVGRAIRGGPSSSVCRNVVAAALLAMRSPQLPDVVDQKLLDRLTVEVEIFGALSPLERRGGGGATGPSASQIRQAVIRGLTGLKASRGLEDAYVLPSTAYLEDETPEQMREICLAGIRLTSSNVGMPVRWSSFTTQHYVGYPDGVIRWLYRGKTLIPYQVVKEADLALAAKTIGEWVVANQDASGMYTVGGIKPTLQEHLYTTMAMAKLLKRQPSQKKLSASVAKAVQYGLGTVREFGGRAYCRVDAGTGEQLGAAAMLVMALEQAPRDEKRSKVRRQLMAGMLAAIGPDGTISSRTDGADGAKDATLTDACLAYMSLSHLRDDQTASKPLAALQARLERTLPQTADEAMWKLRAGLKDLTARAPSHPLRGVGPVRNLPGSDHSEVPGDELGAFVGLPAPDSAAPALPGMADSPRTTLTAWGALAISAGKAWADLPMPAKRELAAGELRRDVWNARCFTYMMMFHPYEAYFAADPRKYVGAVRASPYAARVDLLSCAAAIEALLIKQSHVE